MAVIKPVGGAAVRSTQPEGRDTQLQQSQQIQQLRRTVDQVSRVGQQYIDARARSTAQKSLNTFIEESAQKELELQNAKPEELKKGHTEAFKEWYEKRSSQIKGEIGQDAFRYFNNASNNIRNNAVVRMSAHEKSQAAAESIKGHVDTINTSARALRKDPRFERFDEYTGSAKVGLDADTGMQKSLSPEQNEKIFESGKNVMANSLYEGGLGRRFENSRDRLNYLKSYRNVLEKRTHGSVKALKPNEYDNFLDRYDAEIARIEKMRIANISVNLKNMEAAVKTRETGSPEYKRHVLNLEKDIESMDDGPRKFEEKERFQALKIADSAMNKIPAFDLVTLTSEEQIDKVIDSVLGENMEGFANKTRVANYVRSFIEQDLKKRVEDPKDWVLSQNPEIGKLTGQALIDELMSYKDKTGSVRLLTNNEAASYGQMFAQAQTPGEKSQVIDLVENIVPEEYHHTIITELAEKSDDIPYAMAMRSMFVNPVEKQSIATDIAYYPEAKKAVKDEFGESESDIRTTARSEMRDYIEPLVRTGDINETTKINTLTDLVVARAVRLAQRSQNTVAENIDTAVEQIFERNFEVQQGVLIPKRVLRADMPPPPPTTSGIDGTGGTASVYDSPQLKRLPLEERTQIINSAKVDAFMDYFSSMEGLKQLKPKVPDEFKPVRTADGKEIKETPDEFRYRFMPNPYPAIEFFPEKKFARSEDGFYSFLAEGTKETYWINDGIDAAILVYDDPTDPSNQAVRVVDNMGKPIRFTFEEMTTTDVEAVNKMSESLIKQLVGY